MTFFDQNEPIIIIIVIELCNTLKKIKSCVRKNRYHCTFVELCNGFIHSDPRKVWGNLTFSLITISPHLPSSNNLRDPKGNLLCTPQDL